jgi:hypothetical protein
MISLNDRTPQETTAIAHAATVAFLEVKKLAPELRADAVLYLLGIVLNSGACPAVDPLK